MQKGRPQSRKVGKKGKDMGEEKTLKFLKGVCMGPPKRDKGKLGVTQSSHLTGWGRTPNKEKEKGGN